MTVQILNESLRPSEAMAMLVARHGAARMVVAMVVALVRPTRSLSVLGLSDHLRRDIGL